MFENHCIRCKNPIDKMDFYVTGQHGKICSACLVRQPPAEGSIARLVGCKKPQSLRPAPTAEMSTDEMRRALRRI